MRTCRLRPAAPHGPRRPCALALLALRCGTSPRATSSRTLALPLVASPCWPRPPLSLHPAVRCPTRRPASWPAGLQPSSRGSAGMTAPAQHQQACHKHVHGNCTQVLHASRDCCASARWRGRSGRRAPPPALPGRRQPWRIACGLDAGSRWTSTGAILRNTAPDAEETAGPRGPSCSLQLLLRLLRSHLGGPLACPPCLPSLAAAPPSARRLVGRSEPASRDRPPLLHTPWAAARPLLLHTQPR